MARKMRMSKVFDWSTPLTEFELSNRVRYLLNNDDVKTVGDIVRIGEQGLLRIPGFGVVALREVMKELRPVISGLTSRDRSHADFLKSKGKRGADRITIAGYADGQCFLIHHTERCVFAPDLRDMMKSGADAILVRDTADRLYVEIVNKDDKWQIVHTAHV